MWVDQQPRLVDIKTTLLGPVLNSVPVFALVMSLVDSKGYPRPVALSFCKSLDIIEGGNVPCPPLHGKHGQIGIAFCRMQQVAEAMLWISWVTSSFLLFFSSEVIDQTHHHVASADSSRPPSRWRDSGPHRRGSEAA